MRYAVITLALTLASCGGETSGGNASASSRTRGEVDNRIDCRIGAAEQYERYCTYERADSSDGPVLTIRKPDGGFRRLLVTSDGRGVIAADGAEEAVVTILRDDRIEVAIGGDNFRLPATVRRR